MTAGRGKQNQGRTWVLKMERAVGSVEGGWEIREDFTEAASCDDRI